MKFESHEPERDESIIQNQLPLSSLFYRLEDMRHDDERYENEKQNKGEYRFLYWE